MAVIIKVIAIVVRINSLLIIYLLIYVSNVVKDYIFIIIIHHVLWITGRGRKVRGEMVLLLRVVDDFNIALLTEKSSEPT